MRALVKALMVSPEMPLPRWGHNFFDIGPFLTKPVPFESSHRKLSNGTGFVKNGPISKTL